MKWRQDKIPLKLKTHRNIIYLDSYEIEFIFVNVFFSPQFSDAISQWDNTSPEIYIIILFLNKYFNIVDTENLLEKDRYIKCVVDINMLYDKYIYRLDANMRFWESGFFII